MTRLLRHTLSHTPFALLAAAALLAAPHARAESADRDKPVNIEADRMTVDDIKKESVFEGGVVLTQGSMMLRADRVLVRQDLGGFNFAFAYGKPVYFRQKREGVDEYIEGNAERMEYDGKKDKVEMFTNAQVKKGLDEVHGEYISYDAVTEFYQVFGGGKDGTTAGSPPGRVRAVIQPKKQPENAPQPAAQQPTGGAEASKPQGIMKKLRP